MNEEVLAAQVAAAARSRVFRMAVFFSLCSTVCLALVAVALFMIITGDPGFVVMFCVFGALGFIMTYWARHYVRDLSAAPITVEGEVWRKWHKGNLLIFFLPSFYINVENKIFSIHREDYAMLLEDDQVRLTCYPHSLTVERIERFDKTAKQYVPAARDYTG